MDQGKTGGVEAQRLNPSAADSTLSERLRGHVQRLAGEIGERNVFHPEALHAAAAYIEATWSEQGYTVERQTYRVGSVESANLVVSRAGLRRMSASSPVQCRSR